MAREEETEEEEEAEDGLEQARSCSLVIVYFTDRAMLSRALLLWNLIRELFRFSQKLCGTFGKLFSNGF